MTSNHTFKRNIQSGAFASQILRAALARYAPCGRSTCPLNLALGIFDMPQSESPIRTFAPLFLSTMAMIAFASLGEWLMEAIGFAAVFAELVLFAIVCVIGCVISPTHPFRVGTLGVLGALAGIILDLKIHPTVNGFERNLWPLEIVYHAVISFVCFFATASAWKMAFVFFARRKNNA